MREPISTSDAMLAHIDVLDGRIDRKYIGISTGFTDIDALLTAER